MKFRICYQFYFKRFVFFFLIIDLFFLIPAVISQLFNPIAELVICIAITIKEAKAEIKTKRFASSTHQIFLPYFFKKIISCFVYIF